MKKIYYFTFLFINLISPPIFGAVVEHFQMPAWIETENGKKAMRIGMQIKAKRAVITGDSGKVHIKMEEGSTLKIGSKAKVNVIKIAPAKTKSGIFKSVIHIIQGAFRFTTAAKARYKKRNIHFKIRTITAGIRGTDIWGKSVPEKDFICLLEGKIEVQHKDSHPQTMQGAYTFFVAERGKKAKPIAPISKKKVKKWAKTTNIQKGKGKITKGGRYILNIFSAQKQSYAKKWQRRLDKAGFAIDIKEVIVQGKYWYRLSIHHISSIQDARFLEKKLDQIYAFNSGWISKK